MWQSTVDVIIVLGELQRFFALRRHSLGSLTIQPISLVLQAWWIIITWREI